MERGRTGTASGKGEETVEPRRNDVEPLATVHCEGRENSAIFEVEGRGENALSESGDSTRGPTPKPITKTQITKFLQRGRGVRLGKEKEGMSEKDVHDELGDMVVSSHLRETTGDDGGAETAEEAERGREDGLNPVDENKRSQSRCTSFKEERTEDAPLLQRLPIEGVLGVVLSPRYQLDVDVLAALFEVGRVNANEGGVGGATT